MDNDAEEGEEPEHAEFDINLSKGGSFMEWDDIANAYAEASNF